MIRKIIKLLKNPKRFVQNLTTFLLSNDGSLKKKIIRGGFWVFVLRIFHQGFEFIRTIVLVRLLVPEDFGLMGIALLAMSALENFSQTGVRQALIQKEGDIKDYLDTAWTIQVIRGGVIASVLFFGAPLVGTFFGEPNAVPLTRALALSEIFKGLTHIKVVYFQKELEFHKQFIYQISGTVVDLLVSILAAIILRNPWALVYGLVAGNFIRLILSYLVFSYRPKLNFDKKYAVHLVNFGKYIFFQSIVLFLLTQGDDVFVGRALGTTALGIYQLAYRISNISVTEITHVISSVTFPAYSKLQNNTTKLKKALKLTLNTTTFITLPLSAGIFILAPELTKLFLGESWIAAIPVIRILSIYGGMRSIAAIFGPIYRATDNLEVPLKINITQLVILMIIIWPFSNKFGTEGASIAVTIMLAVGLFLTSIQASKILNIKLLNLYKPIIKSLVFSVIMILIVYLFKTHVLRGKHVFSLLMLIGIGILQYFTSHLIYNLIFTKKL